MMSTADRKPAPVKGPQHTVTPAWWNLDGYVTSLLALATRRFAEQGATYPAGMTAEEWNALLDGVATKLEAYAHALNRSGSPRPETIADAQDALRTIADNLPNLWS
jgi:hypothetical protein